MLTLSKSRAISWFFMIAVFLAALIFGTLDSRTAETPAERAASLASTIACPQCSGQPVSESSAPIAQVIRAEIKEQVDQGLSDSEIKAIYIQRYGAWVNLNPSNKGFDSIVWIAPFLIIGIALGGITLAYSRRKSDLERVGLTSDEEQKVLAMREEFKENEYPAQGNKEQPIGE
ncbi:MAG: cytochrome c-type biogenesis protein [Actinomycetota bacterium]|nr:cytochrome c-type biogenesis protein [Actinomycetota bacterium]